MSRMGTMRDRLSRSISPAKSPSQLFDSHLDLNDVNMSSLVEELKAARTLNRSLTEKLAQAESDLELAHRCKEEMQVEMEAKVAARGAALVDKIYAAQKERDAAILARLKMANDERNEAVERLKNWRKTEVLILVSFNELLRKVESADNGRLIERHGSVIADRLAKVQRMPNKRKNVDDEQRLIKERDEARSQVKRLEEEIEKIKKEKTENEENRRNSERTRLKACQAQLKSVLREKEDADNRARQLKEELENLRVYYSLHKSLSQEQGLRDQFNSTMDNFEEKLRATEGELQLAQRNYEDAVAKANALIREKSAMASQLHDTLAQLKEEKTRADKLERLVAVLRKRIAGNPVTEQM
ncbi:mirror-image polydactyly gene 1 protein-like [Rhopilema esculentum]|uniref:mirror-image polydactyly gene 1 protein-like n=1 Tax=Rhopilema esculentum TaxID=499914 RepID=UPI0031CEB09A